MKWNPFMQLNYMHIQFFHCNSFTFIQVWLALEQLGFELCGFSLYKYILHYYTTDIWVNPQMQNCTYGEPTVNLLVDFQLYKRSVPQPHTI